MLTHRRNKLLICRDAGSILKVRSTVTLGALSLLPTRVYLVCALVKNIETKVFPGQHPKQKERCICLGFDGTQRQ